MRGSLKGHGNVVDELLGKGASIDLHDNDGSWSCEEVVESDFLVERPSDRDSMQQRRCGVDLPGSESGRAQPT
jgi:hypothetical protein